MLEDIVKKKRENAGLFYLFNSLPDNKILDWSKLKQHFKRAFKMENKYHLG